MAAKVLSKDTSVLKLEWKAPLAVVNSLRRIILSEIPTVALAFDPLTDENPDIKIHVNRSALHNEFLAHRLSLLPMGFTQAEIENFDPANYTMKLKVKNTTTEMVNVTTHDIAIHDAQDKKYPPAFHERIFPKNSVTKDYVLITVLRPNSCNQAEGEELDIEFKGSVNIAKTHARWSPVSCCTLENMIDEEAATKALQEKLQTIEKDADKEAYRRKFETLDKYRCYHVDEKGEANRFIFTIESECGMPPESILLQAFDVLVTKLEKFKESKIEAKKIHEHELLYEMVIQGEDFTLLHLLQSMIYDAEINKTIDYIGYHQPHPLDEKMVLKFRLLKALDVWEWMTGCTDSIIAMLRNMQKEVL